MSSLFEIYNWQLISQIILIVSISVTVLFFERLKKYSDILVALPFSLSLGISIFYSENLISYFFFSEVLFNISKIIYSNGYKKYSGSLFENTRYIFWLIILFSYYTAFGSFQFSVVPKVIGLELTFVIGLLLSLVFIMLLNFVLRKERDIEYIIESIGYEIFTISIFSLKTLLIVSDMTDTMPPKYHIVIDFLIFTFIAIGSLLGLRFKNCSNISKLKSIIRTLVILSLFPLVLIGGHSFWDNFSIFSVYLILGFIGLELVTRLGKNNKFKSLIVFLIVCFITGISPFGHIFNLFKALVDSDNQVIVFFSIVTSVLAIGIMSKKLFELSYKRAL